MAKNKKISRKQLLKEPDKIITTSGKIIQFLLEYKQWVIRTTVGLVALILIFSGVKYFLNVAENNAFTRLDKGMNDYNQLANEKGPKEALSEVEKEFEEIVDQYSGRTGGKFARLFYADICYHAGNTEKAITLYQSALKDFGNIQPYKNLILNSMGFAYEENKDDAAAARYFEQIASGSHPLMRDDALFALGRIYKTMGQIQKSVDTYKTLIEEYPDYFYVDIAKDIVSSHS